MFQVVSPNGSKNATFNDSAVSKLFTHKKKAHMVQLIKGFISQKNGPKS